MFVKNMTAVKAYQVYFKMMSKPSLHGAIQAMMIVL